MLMFIYFIILLFLSDKLLGNNVIRQFNKIPEKNEFYLNETVTLACEIQEIKNSLVSVFRKNKTMYAEGCRAFNTKKYEMACIELLRNEKKFIEYKFKIKHLEWSDRGQWECLYVQNKKAVVVEIKVPAKFEKLEIDPIKPAETKLENTGPAFITVDSKTNYILKGRGSRTNPYNLREGIALKISCFSSCSYPKTDHLWSYANVSNGPIDITVKNQKLRDICSSTTNEGMYSTQSEITINCTALKMVGANEIVCKSESDKTSVYVLCPGGERPWELTTGEIVGLATSVGIIILLIFLLCLMIKRSRSAYHTPPDVSTNTYSSGVKV